MIAHRWLSKLGIFIYATTLGIAWAQTSSNQVQLTQEERAYVQRKGTVNLCVDPDWTPFERLNEEGQHEGIAADLVKLVAQRTGLNIQPLTVATWEESLQASKAGRCEAMSFLNRTPEREKWLTFTSPIFTDPNVLITREEHPYIADLGSLEEQTIVLPRGTMVEERIHRDFPLLKVLTTATESEAMEMVSERKADMTMRSLIVAAYTIKNEGLFNLKIAGQVPEYANALRMGVIKSTDPLLLSVLEKGVQSITPQEREAISNRHVAIQVQQGVDHRILWKIVGGALVLLLVAAFWHRKLRQLDRERTALAQAQVEQALRAQQEQSQLMALLSHEVRTSLSMIDGAAGSLRLLLKPEDESSQLRIDRIRTGVKRLIELSDQFLTKDRMDSGALTPKIAEVDALTLCQDVLGNLQDKERITIEYHGTTSLQADPDLLQVAVRNLLVNALRYTPSGTPVTLSIQGHSEDLTLQVCDEGTGIPSEEQAVIFNRYTRGTNEQSKPGSGLGLHLVKRVAELHGGQLSLASAPGHGTCFTLRLPTKHGTSSS